MVTNNIVINYVTSTEVQTSTWSVFTNHSLECSCLTLQIFLYLEAFKFAILEKQTNTVLESGW